MKISIHDCVVIRIADGNWNKHNIKMQQKEYCGQWGNLEELAATASIALNSEE